MAKNKANNVKNQSFPRYLDLFVYFCTIVNSNQSIDTIQSGLPRPVLDASFAVMIAAAVCSHHSIQEWLLNYAPIPFAILTTLGMVIIYYAFLRGMKTLHHPLTVLWWITIAANILGFLIVCLGDKFHGVSAIVATFLPLIYLPLGGLLFIWYRGRLGLAGLWMAIRILVLNLVPVLFYVTGLLEKTWGMLVMEIITIGIELWYAWTLRRVLR